MINTVLGQVSVIANDMVFLKSKQLFYRQIALFYCCSVPYLVLKNFYVNVIDRFWENQGFLDKHRFRPNSVIANDMVFLKKKQLF